MTLDELVKIAKDCKNATENRMVARLKMYDAIETFCKERGVTPSPRPDADRQFANDFHAARRLVNRLYAHEIAYSYYEDDDFGDYNEDDDSE